jgi:hypothetical protein
MNTDYEHSSEGLLLLIKNLQSNRTYRKFKERRLASPYVKDDILLEEDDDQKKWDNLLEECLSRLEEDALL